VRPHLHIVLAFVLVIIGAARAPAANDVEALRRKYLTELDGPVSAHKTAVTNLQNRYVASLAELRSKAQSQGNLDVTVAAIEESKRFETTHTIPDDLSKTNQADVRKLQTAFAESLAGLDMEKARRVIALVTAYDTALDSLQRQLTKDGKIEDAVAVSQERKDIKADQLILWANELVAQKKESLKGSEATASQGAGGAAMQRSYDAVKDFSLAENPNGPWSYGYSSSATKADFIASPSVFGSKFSKLEGWYANKSGTTLHPSVEHNKTLGLIYYAGITHPPDCLHMHPGRLGHRSIVRFTVPTQGTYKVQGAFKALAQTTTDPHVLVNDKELMFIKPINHGNQRQNFSFTRQFAKGDTIDFAVGNGGNGYESDSTGLTLTVTPVGTP